MSFFSHHLSLPRHKQHLTFCLPLSRFLGFFRHHHTHSTMGLFSTSPEKKEEKAMKKGMSPAPQQQLTPQRPSRTTRP